MATIAPSPPNPADAARRFRPSTSSRSPPVAAPTRLPQKATSSLAIVTAPPRKPIAEPQREHQQQQEQQKHKEQQHKRQDEEERTLMENAWCSPTTSRPSPASISSQATKPSSKPSLQSSPGARPKLQKVKGANLRRAAHVREGRSAHQVPQVFSLGMPPPPCSAELADLLMTYSRTLRHVSAARGIERARVQQAAIEVVGRVRMGVRESLAPVACLRTDGRQEAAGAEEVLWQLDQELAYMQESMVEDPFAVPIFDVTFSCEQAARRLRSL